MKFNAIVLFCTLTYYVEAQYCKGENLKGVITKCVAEEKAIYDDFNDIFDFHDAASESAKCLRACIMRECEILDASNNIDRLVLKKYLSLMSAGDVGKESIVAAVTDKCLKLTKFTENACHFADGYIDCFAKNCKRCELDLYSAFEVEKM